MRVLVLGETAQLVCDALRMDPRVSETVAGRHVGDSSDLEVGEPTYDLVLHDCEINRDGYLSDLPSVSDRFLNEVSVSGGVHVSLVRQGQSHPGTGHIRAAISSDQSGEASPALVTSDHPQSIHLEPFLDSHGSLLGRQRIMVQHGYTQKPGGGATSPTYGDPHALVVNQYGNAVVAVGNISSVSVIAMPRPRTGEVEDDCVRLLLAFATRAVTSMHPQLLHGLYTSPAADDLRSAIGAEVRRHRSELGRLQEQLGVEETFLAWHAPLAATQDEILKLSVKAALEAVFGLEVEDLDEAFAEEKLADLHVPEHELLIETRGSGRRNASKADVEGVDDHATRLIEGGYSVSKRVLLFNGQLSIQERSRAAQPFGPAVVTEARARKVALTTGAELLGWVIAARAGDFSTDELLAQWSKPGPSEA